ncbi:MAG: hypothetical protein HOP22_16605 [Nitrospiraceae bacterium]|nr:hypothetical protein [Nitrospiraceae bacterium]
MHHIRSSFLALAVTASLLFGAGISVTPASAATITYNFTGNVTQVQNQLNPPFTVQVLNLTAMKGSIVVDTADQFTSGPQSARFGEYRITNFSVDVEGKTFTLAPLLPGVFGVEIQNGLPGQDEFNATVIAPNGPNIPGPDFFVPSVFDIKLHAPGSQVPAVFTSDALPTTVPSISSFTTKNEWRLEFGPGGKAVSGVITAMTAVPLPASIILFGVGLVALIGLGAGNWRKQNSSLA